MNSKFQKHTLLIFIALISGACAAGGKSLHSGQSTSSHQKHLWEYKRAGANMYTLTDEIKIGEQILTRQIAEFHKKKLAVDPPEFQKTKSRIEAIVGRLAKVSDQPGLPFEVHIFSKPEIANAYCLPGGKIGIFTGLFDPQKGLVHTQKDNEIAAVLAHEMAHATLRHVTRKLTTYNSLSLFGNLISVGIGASGAGQDWQSAFGQVFSTGTALFFPSYSRKQESEADQVGFYYMVKAGYDPQVAIQIWEQAAQESSRTHKGKNQFFSTHPASGVRAENLKKFLPDVEIVKKELKMQVEMKKER